MSGVRRSVVVIPGEDASPAAVRAAIDLIDSAGAPIDWIWPPVGTPAVASHGTTFPEETKAAIDGADTTFFGSTSGASLGAMVYLRFDKATYANVRPFRTIVGARSPLARPEGIDVVIVRENHEGLYVGAEGSLDRLAGLGHQYPLGGALEDRDGRYAIKAVTREATERITRFACDIVRRRAERGGQSRLTIASKHNILFSSDGWFEQLARAVATEHDDIEVESLHIDDVCHRLVIDPQRFDVIVTMNLYGDILSDLGAGLVGGLGLAPSGCYGDDYAYFEPIHGTAPDLAGKELINPTGQILSGVLMLRHLGLSDAAERIEHAVDEQYASGQHLTADQGGSASTLEFTEAVRARL